MYQFECVISPSVLPCKYYELFVRIANLLCLNVVLLILYFVIVVIDVSSTDQWNCCALVLYTETVSH